jgi:hypothetical protein
MKIEAGVGRGQIDVSWALSIPWFTMRFMALPVPRQYDNHHIATGDSFIMHVSRWSLSLVAGGIIYAKSNLDSLIVKISSNLRGVRPRTEGFELGFHAETAR